LSETEASEEAIRLLQQRLARAFTARDFDAVLDCYTDDAVLLAPGRPAALGKAAIARELRAAFADPNVDVTVTTARIEIAADARLASAWGTGLTTVTDAATLHQARIASKWLAVYRRDIDGWKVIADAFNVDEPMP
jgi:uncharacterized protein (TIGR02246 family)